MPTDERDGRPSPAERERLRATWRAAAALEPSDDEPEEVTFLRWERHTDRESRRLSEEELRGVRRLGRGMEHRRAEGRNRKLSACWYYYMLTRHRTQIAPLGGHGTKEAGKRAPELDGTALELLVEGEAFGEGLEGPDLLVAAVLEVQRAYGYGSPRAALDALDASRPIFRSASGLDFELPGVATLDLRT
jgi:hypothetical protein